MDGRDFDNLLRSLTESRRTVLGGAAAALGAALGITPVLGKKKKKKCAKKCADGCCTSKRGTCIRRDQQSSTQCGVNGEICRTNCEGQPPPDNETCGPENCQGGCCAGKTCEFSTNDHCGVSGAACVPCGANEDCFAGKCCGLPGHTCAGDGECCLSRLCEEGKCCAVYGTTCNKDSDCCDPETLVCSNGECLIKSGQPCEPLQRCQGGLSCPGSLICGEECPEEWETCSDGSCCAPDQFCENQGELARCCPLATGCQA